MPQSSIIDLDQLILDFAHAQQKENVKPALKRRYKSEDFTWKKLNKIINTSELEIDHREAVYSSMTAQEPKKNVIFKSEYSNNTNKDVTYTISTTRTTRTSDTCKITKGFTFGLSFDLKIGPPNMGAGIGLGATAEFRFDKSAETTREQEVSWSTDTTIVVPPNTTKIVSLVVKEGEHSGTFKAKTFFHGKVSVEMRKDNIHVSKVTIDDLSELFTTQDGFERDAEGNVYYESKGIYHYRHGFEQKFEVEEQTLEA